jgi:hypothetical protein
MLIKDHINCTGKWQRCGFFIRKSDGQRIKRYRCSKCKKSTSDAHKSPCYRQNKRHMNSQVEKLICSGVSQRRIALILKISRLTVFRKFEYLFEQAKLNNIKDLEKLKNEKLSEVFLDEMEDKVHTKCKPVAIALVVTNQRKILMHEVSRIRPKNKELNKLSKKKYPEWTPNSRAGFKKVINKLAPLVLDDVIIKSDEKQMYAQEISKILPHSKHITFLSRKAVIAGQGELKKGGRDPLFELNHTCAMLRANINRLIRRTWCTTKKLEFLYKHIEIYTHFHNHVLT